MVILPEITWIQFSFKVQQPLLSGQTCAATAHRPHKAESSYEHGPRKITSLLKTLRDIFCYELCNLVTCQKGWTCLLGSDDTEIISKAIVIDGVVLGKEGTALIHEGLRKRGRGSWDRRWWHVLTQKRWRDKPEWEHLFSSEVLLLISCGKGKLRGRLAEWQCGSCAKGRW